jgi:hypothetical protein
MSGVAMTPLLIVPVVFFCAPVLLPWLFWASVWTSMDAAL